MGTNEKRAIETDSHLWGEHENSTQKDGAFKTKTFLLECSKIMKFNAIDTEEHGGYTDQ